MQLRLAALLFATLGVASVGAQSHAGVRAGVSADPGQFFFGGHIESRPLANQLTFRPNIEIGVGDGLAAVAINLEFVHSVRLSQNPWRIYLGGGPAAVIRSVHGRRDDGSVGGGFNLLVGAQHREGLLGEFKIGLVDSPELKVTVGYAFK